MKNTLYGFINVPYTSDEADIRIAIAEKTKQLFIKGNPTPDELAKLDMAEAVLLNPENRKIYNREIKDRIEIAKRNAAGSGFDLGLIMLALPLLVSSTVVMVSTLAKNYVAEIYLVLFAYFFVALCSSICARHDKVHNTDEDILESVSYKFCMCIFLFWPVCYPYYFYLRNGKSYSALFYISILIVILEVAYLSHPLYDIFLGLHYFSWHSTPLK